MIKLHAIVASILFATALYVPAIYAQEKAVPLSLKTREKVIQDICFSASGEVLAVADGNTAAFYSTSTLELLASFSDGHQQRILTLDLSADSTYLATGSRDSTALLWDLRSGQVILRLDAHGGVVNSVKISRDNRFLVTGGSGGLVNVFSIPEGKLLHQLSHHSGQVTSVDISPDGSLLATSGSDQSIHLYALENAEPLYIFTDHHAWIRELIFNSDGTVLSSCDDRSTVIQRTLSRKTLPPMEFRVSINWLLSLDLHPVDASVLSGGMDGRVRIHTRTAKFNYWVKAPIHRVRFQPGVEGSYMVAVATRGKGVLLISSLSMNTSE